MSLYRCKKYVGRRWEDRKVAHYRCMWRWCMRQEQGSSSPALELRYGVFGVYSGVQEGGAHVGSVGFPPRNLHHRVGVRIQFSKVIENSQKEVVTEAETTHDHPRRCFLRERNTRRRIARSFREQEADENCSFRRSNQSLGPVQDFGNLEKMKTRESAWNRVLRLVVVQKFRNSDGNSAGTGNRECQAQEFWWFA